ncbi:hypothetical protein QNI16_38025 [Cytophagaceae bacterium YF14B1]|uniref:Uncharacterized protein n=1 Tax=Xanthocytophaga flava TaxID=3048013 RepID=A0AAE3R052_9BACT|nr:hypothetical protein [Xanthocytophaga flavus]MDJ1486340.1 hypothetical protein [Xanthocytophaga flavus]
MNYTIIYYPLLRQFDITMPEYALIFAIDGLSAKTGWCYASRTELADCICMKQRWIYDSLNRLTRKGLVEVDSQTRFLRAGKIWKKALAKCKTEGSTSSEASYAENAERMQKMQRQKAQKTYRQAMHEVQSAYAENAKEPVQKMQSPMHDSPLGYAQNAALPMHDLQSGYAQNADYN